MCDRLISAEPVYSASDDSLSPHPWARRDSLSFVSREALPGACGHRETSTSRTSRAAGRGQSRSVILCAPAGTQQRARRAGPVLRRRERQGSRQEAAVLLSQLRLPGRGRRDLSVSTERVAAPASNSRAPRSPSSTTRPANDIQPNVRANGLEVVFSSNRAGGLGAQDIWHRHAGSARPIRSRPRSTSERS